MLDLSSRLNLPGSQNETMELKPSLVDTVSTAHEADWATISDLLDSSHPPTPRHGMTRLAERYIKART